MTILSNEVTLKVAQYSFQHLDFDGSLQPVFITRCNNHGFKTLPKPLVKVTIATERPP